MRSAHDDVVRHLTEQQANAALRRGVPIEQLMTTSLAEGTVTWLELSATGDGFVLRRHHVLDDGLDDFIDVYVFRAVNEDDYIGEGVVLGTFHDAQGAFEAASRVGADMSRWVNGGVVQREYADLR